MEMHNVFIMAVDTPAHVLPSAVLVARSSTDIALHTCVLTQPDVGNVREKQPGPPCSPGFWGDDGAGLQECHNDPLHIKVLRWDWGKCWLMEPCGWDPLVDHCSSAESCGLSKPAFTQWWPCLGMAGDRNVPSSSTGWPCGWPFIPCCTLQLSPAGSAAQTPQRGAPLHHPARGKAEIAHNGIITHTQAGLLTGRINGGSPSSSSAGGQRMVHKPPRMGQKSSNGAGFGPGADHA